LPAQAGALRADALLVTPFQMGSSQILRLGAVTQKKTNSSRRQAIPPYNFVRPQNVDSITVDKNVHRDGKAITQS